MPKPEKIDKCPRERCENWSVIRERCTLSFFNGKDIINLCRLDRRLKNLCELK